MEGLQKKYPHMLFKKNWKISKSTYFQIGQCDAILKAITNTPIRPDYRENLHHVALVKGAQATTAIEGNTLSYEEIEAVEKGEKLQPSKEYLEKEVKNIINAFNVILENTLINKEISLITPELIREFHKMVGIDRGEHFTAIPGSFRKNFVAVNRYKAPDFKDVPELTKQLCLWIKKEFHYDKGQTFEESIIQAIVTHIYIAWIHPFSDGNGRTARLLEYYLLLRAGVPDIASHILSNFYNLTRNEYYRQIEKAHNERDISSFIAYAVQGFRDELLAILNKIQESQLLVAWRNYIYGIYDSHKGAGKTVQANKRRRKLILAIPHDKYLSEEEIINLKIEIVKMYSDLSEKSFQRDIDELIKLDLLDKENNKYRAKIEILTRYMAFKLD